MLMRYDEDEERDRSLFMARFSGHIETVVWTDLFDGVDAHITGKTGVTAVIEIKRRHMDSGRYAEYILELPKALDMLRAKEETGSDKALYVCIFDDGICMWEVTPETVRDGNVTVRPMTHYTTGGYGYEYVDKEIIMLSTEDALWKGRRR